MKDIMLSIICFLFMVGFVGTFAMAGLDLIIKITHLFWEILCWITRKLGGKR